MQKRQQLAHKGMVTLIADLEDEFDNLFHLFKFPQKRTESGLMSCISVEWMKTGFSAVLPNTATWSVRRLPGKPFRSTLSHMRKRMASGCYVRGILNACADYHDVGKGPVVNEGDYRITGNTLCIKFVRYKLSHTMHSCRFKKAYKDV